MDRAEEFDPVYETERKEIERRRAWLKQPLPPASEKGPSPKVGLTGLAFSGGGIRSAAFCLGVAQALAEARLFPWIDYLSTVSGGGYTGSALSVLLNHGDEAAIRDPAKFPLRMPLGESEAPALRHLRNGSDYLTPPGLINSLRLPVVVARVMLLGPLMFLPLVFAAALLTTLFYEIIWPALLNRWGDRVIAAMEFPRPGVSAIAGLLLVVAIFPFVSALMKSRAGLVGRRRLDYATTLFASGALLILVLWPLAAVTDFAMFHSLSDGLALISGPAHFIVHNRIGQVGSVATILTVSLAARRWAFVRSIVRQVGQVVGAVIPPAVLFGVYLTLCFWQVDHQFTLQHADVLIDAAHQSNTDRPVALPAALERQLAEHRFLPFGPHKWVWIPIGNHSDEAKSEFTNVAEYATTWRDHEAHVFFQRFGRNQEVRAIIDGSIDEPQFLFFAFLTFIYLLGSIIALDVNLTSLHSFYRDQLAQVFLRRERRKGDPEDLGPMIPEDTLKLSKLGNPDGAGCCAPYHLLNATINLTGSSEESLRGRNGEPFIFSRRFVGSEQVGWARTEDVEKVDSHLDLGTAMAISAAAASPNMGTYTSRTLSFLMVLLGARMGYWLPNPKPALLNGLHRFPPGVMYLLREALGVLHAKAEYVNVSDGGHIENLGVYELLRRQCKIIIAVDAEEDVDLNFSALSTLVRFAAIDFGVEINIDLEALRRDANNLSHAHFAVGSINYGPDEDEGMLVYLKATLTGDERLFVGTYSRTNPGFPHESTADQFFTETQFEMYRALGRHVGRGAWGLKPGTSANDLVPTVARDPDARRSSTLPAAVAGPLTK